MTRVPAGSRPRCWGQISSPRTTARRQGWPYEVGKPQGRSATPRRPRRRRRAWRTRAPRRCARAGFRRAESSGSSCCPAAGARNTPRHRIGGSWVLRSNDRSASERGHARPGHRGLWLGDASILLHNEGPTFSWACLRGSGMAWGLSRICLIRTHVLSWSAGNPLPGRCHDHRPSSMLRRSLSWTSTCRRMALLASRTARRRLAARFTTGSWPPCFWQTGAPLIDQHQHRTPWWFRDWQRRWSGGRPGYGTVSSLSPRCGTVGRMSTRGRHGLRPSLLPAVPSHQLVHRGPQLREGCLALRTEELGHLVQLLLGWVDPALPRQLPQPGLRVPRRTRPAPNPWRGGVRRTQWPPQTPRRRSPRHVTWRRRAGLAWPPPDRIRTRDVVQQRRGQDAAIHLGGGHPISSGPR